MVIFNSKENHGFLVQTPLDHHHKTNIATYILNVSGRCMSVSLTLGKN